MIFTFYSYKGGVGRSMALAATARALAMRGLRVLAVDFDLEAPGLERYFLDGEGSRSRRAEPGLIDLIAKYKEALTSQAAFERADFRQLDAYQLPVIHSAGTLGGSVHLLSAGCREPADKLRDYALAVRNFNWQDFFYNWKGDRFFDWLRRRWLATDGRGFDAVLVDSRTGVTEMGGVCTYQLADAVVMLSAPNWQNLEGTRDVARDFTSDNVRALRRGKPLQTLAIPARLAAEHPKRQAFLDDFAREMGVLGMPQVLAEAGLGYERLALRYEIALSVGEMAVGAPQAAELTGFHADIERLASALLLLTDGSGAFERPRAEAEAEFAGTGVPRAQAMEADTTKTSAGYDAFIDYGRDDHAFAMKLWERLSDGGLRVFIDRTELELGAHFAQRIEVALSYSANLLLLFGRSSGSGWRSRLLAEARKRRGVRIIPVLLPGADEKALRSFGLDELHWLDLRHESETGYARLLQGLLEQARADEPGAARGTQAANPFPGALPFDESDATRFFGRSSETMRIAQALDGHPVVVLQGAARVGKTSLVRAGLLPALRERKAGARLRSTTLIDARQPAWPELPPSHAPTRDPTFDLVIVDHLDSETTTGLDAATRARRVDALVQGSHQARKLLLVCRGTEPTLLPAAGTATVLTLAAMDAAALREAIEAPARSTGQLLEPGLVERLIDSAGPARNAVSQLQPVLHLLWEQRRRGWITNQALDELGHLGGAFAKRARATLATFDDPTRHWALLLALLSVDASGAWLPRARPWPVLAGLGALRTDLAAAVALRDRLADAGLVDLWSEAGPDGACTVKLSSVRPDSRPLFEPDAAYAGSTAFLRWRQAVEPMVAAWVAQPDSDQGLLTERALEDSRHWLGQAPGWLLAEERRYIERSVERGVVQLAAGDSTTTEAVAGRDVVMFQTADGSEITLHPESARELLAPQRASRPSFLSGLLLRGLKVMTVSGSDNRPFIELVRELEGPPGRLVRCDGDPPFGGPAPSSPVGIEDARQPVLVLIPGVLVDSVATFSGLWSKQPAQWQRLRKAYAGQVYASAHAAIGTDPIDNAIGFVEACAPGTRLHLLTHGSGGLVAELLVRASALDAAGATALDEAANARLARLASHLQASRIRIERVVRVAGPLRGQLLMSGKLDGHLATLVWSAEHAGVVLPALARELLVEAARQRIDPATLPGLAASLPGSPLLRWLPAADEPVDSVLRVIAGKRVGGSGDGWFRSLATDAFFLSDNDLVVPTRSMFGGALRHQPALFFLDESAQTHHFGYFGDTRCAEAIVAALLDEAPPQFRPIGPLSWAGDSPTGSR